MDPISEAIIAALVSGVLTGVTSTAQNTVTAQYHALKDRLLAKNVTNHRDLADALAELEAVPTSRERQDLVLEKVAAVKLSRAQDLIEQAQDLLKQVEQVTKGIQVIQRADNSAISNTGTAITYNVQGDQYNNQFPLPNMPKSVEDQGLETLSSKGPHPYHLPSQPIKPQSLKFTIPEMGVYFFGRNRQDRTDLITIVDTIVSSITTTDGIKNLLRGKLPDAQINRLNLRDGSRNIAESIVGNLEPRGVLSPPHHHYHALGAFLYDLIEDEIVSYDAAIKIVTLLFKYTLLADKEQIKKLSARFQVPSPLLTEEALARHPLVPALLPSPLPLTDVQERFETLYHRRRYLLDVKFLREGAKAARSVCRIDFDKRGEGTGFLVAPDLVLTNYHVMAPPGYRGDLEDRARRCEIKFGVIEGERAGAPFTLDKNTWMLAQSGPEELDFLLLKLDRPVHDHIKPLSLETYPIQVDDFVNIIQHPHGGSMEVSIRFNQIVAVDDQRMYYLADTEEGSSGSPVFDDSWRLVGLHHSGGKLDNAGNPVIAANIGIPIHAILEQIKPFI